VLYVKIYDNSTFCPHKFHALENYSGDEFYDQFLKIKKTVIDYDVKCINAKLGNDIDEVIKMMDDTSRVFPFGKRQILLLSNSGNIIKQTTMSFYIQKMIKINLEDFFPMGNYIPVL
jgi:hypothetical protein